MFFLKKIFSFLMENLYCQRYVPTIICACLCNEDRLED